MSSLPAEEEVAENKQRRLWRGNGRGRVAIDERSVSMLFTHRGQTLLYGFRHRRRRESDCECKWVSVTFDLLGRFPAV